MCSIEGCDCEKIFAKGLCQRHYNQIRKYGKVLTRTIKDRNEIVILEDHAEVIMYNIRCEEVGRVLIDIEDVDKVKPYKWSDSGDQHGTHYATSNDKQWSRMHRLIMNVTDKNLVVDHINHNGYDNRKYNLRICTNSENICNCKTPKNNKSGCKGVYWAKDKNKWTAQVTINNKTKYIGRFINYEDAVKARLDAEKEYYGEFAYNELKDSLENN